MLACRAAARRIYLQSVGPEHNHDDPLQSCLSRRQVPERPRSLVTVPGLFLSYLGIVAAKHFGDAFGGASKPVAKTATDGTFLLRASRCR